MRPRITLRAIALGLAIIATGCASPPNADVDAARAAVDKAAASGAGQYASESFQKAQDAQAALEAELKAQQGKWFKSYDKTRELAITARAAGDTATTEAAAGKEKADALAASERAARAAAAARAKLVKDAVRVGGRVKAPIKIKDVRPIYPAVAESARVSGAVTVEATVGPDGRVIDARVVRSVPLLDQAAIDAVSQWEYKPALLNGAPVPVLVTVRIDFTR